MVNSRDLAGNAIEEEEEEGGGTPEIKLGTQQKEKVNPKDIAGKAEEEEQGEPQRYSWERRKR